MRRASGGEAGFRTCVLRWGRGGCIYTHQHALSRCGHDLRVATHYASHIGCRYVVLHAEYGRVSRAHYVRVRVVKSKEYFTVYSKRARFVLDLSAHCRPVWCVCRSRISVPLVYSQYTNVRKKHSHTVLPVKQTNNTCYKAPIKGAGGVRLYARHI